MRNDTFQESMQDSERVIVRRVSSFQPHRLGKEGKGEGDEEFSTQRSVSISRVRVEVGGKKLYKGKKKIKDIPRKKPNTFFDSLFSKLKSFAKVTLSSKEKSENLYSSTHINGSGVSLGNIKRGNESESFNDNVYENNDSVDKTYLGSESHIGIHTYGDQQELVISNSDNSREEKILDGNSSSNEGKVGIEQESESDNVTDKMGRNRSKEARGRSLWGMRRGSERQILDQEEIKTEDVNNISFSNDRTVKENPIAIEKETNIILNQESRIYLLEFSNIVIIIIAVGIFITIAVGMV
jgi:hypothetical protein